MRIALDYDGTYTCDPALWDLFIQNAQQRGHEVVVVTMRSVAECTELLEGMLRRNQLELKVFMTNRKAKAPFMDGLGLHVDVWIDDMPHFVIEDAWCAEKE